MNYEEILPEIVVPGMRLGRHVRHDPRSLRFPFKAPTITLTSRRWSNPSTPILDQGDVGSCTGNATVGALMCDPFIPTLTVDQAAGLNETLALRIYSRATETDPWQGTYRPDDTGSDGLDVAKAAAEFGYISGFTNAFSLNDALAALTLSPIIVGIGWWDGFDRPDHSGLVSISGQNRGGHEVCLDEIDVTRRVVWFRNSWTSGWGVQGRACFSFETLGQLLSQDGDATVFTPLTLPTPTPIPAPPAPTPTPPDPASVDQTLVKETRYWSGTKHYGSNREAAASIIKWRVARGF